MTMAMTSEARTAALAADKQASSFGETMIRVGESTSVERPLDDMSCVIEGITALLCEGRALRALLEARLGSER